MTTTPLTVTIFEDDEDLVFICRYAFQEKGWKVFSFDNCSAIEEKVLLNKPDVIIMDNWIPDKGGVAATQALKRSPLLQHIPVILFSANNNLEQLAVEAGADAYIFKPFDIKEMMAKVETLVHSSEK
ncbi:MAG: response regulator [Agriterribacter sp.]